MRGWTRLWWNQLSFSTAGRERSDRVVGGDEAARPAEHAERLGFLIAESHDRKTHKAVSRLRATRAYSVTCSGVHTPPKTNDHRCLGKRAAEATVTAAGLALSEWSRGAGC